MTLGLRKRYYCTNLVACPYARADHAYSKPEHSKYNGSCGGINGDGCGAKLEEGYPLDKRLTYAIAVALLSISSLLVFQYLNPPPLSEIAFARNTSHIEEKGAVVEVDVLRAHPANERLVVRYRTLNGQAKAGHDYESKAGELIFASGDAKKSIAITILPDNDYTEEAENFSIILTNVSTKPQHVIFIDERKPDHEALQKADALVRSVSGLATDIAGFYVKSATIRRILDKDLSLETRLRQQYQNTLATIDKNMQRARERYAEIFHDLKNIERIAVVHAIDNWIASLDRGEFIQQREATVIMQKQLEAYLSTGIIEMDLWVQQLSKSIPQPEDNSQDGAGVLL